MFFSPCCRAWSFTVVKDCVIPTSPEWRQMLAGAGRGRGGYPLPLVWGREGVRGTPSAGAAESHTLSSQSSASASVDAPAGSLIVTTLLPCHHFPGRHLAVFLALPKPTVQWSLTPPMKEAAADRLSTLPCCTDHRASGHREGPGPRRLDSRFLGVPPTRPWWCLSSVFSIV